MNLGVIEVRRARLRFGLLTAAVGLLVFLIVFLSSLSGALLRSLTGALESLPADGLVYAEAARANVQGSRLDPATTEQVAGVPDVAEASPMSVLTVTATVAGQPDALTLIGVTPDSPGQPAGLREGRFPSDPGEVAVDASEAEIAVGDAIRVNGMSSDLVVTGRMVGTQLGADTAWLSTEGYQQVLGELSPEVESVPINAVAFSVADGADPARVAEQVQEVVPGTQALTLPAAVDAIPGVESIGRTFGLLVGITFVIGVVVVGFFFLILTVQKLRTFTLLRAVGASTRALAMTVVSQITIVVVLASAVATLLAWGALQAMSAGLPVAIDPLTTAGVVAAVLVASLAAGILSVRRIARIDPASAAGAR